MSDVKNESIQANVIYLKTDRRDFYAFANTADSGYKPQIRTLAVENTFYLIIVSKFKLKKIREKTLNRLDIYMSVEDALQLGQRIQVYDKKGTARFSGGNPQSTWSGGTEIPEVIAAYQSGCYSVFADIAGRTLSYVDETGLTRVHIDLEKAKPSHKVMEPVEVHIGISMEPSVQSDKAHIYISDSYFNALKTTDGPEGGPDGLDPIVYGTAPGLIICNLGRSQIANIGSALIEIVEKAAGSKITTP